MLVFEDLSEKTNKTTASEALGLPRSTYYCLKNKSQSPKRQALKKPHPLELSKQERQEVLDLLHSERFVDKSPGEIVPMLLDEGRYLCSERTMYRILAQENELKERRQKVRVGCYQKPELLAQLPNQVWSWDITKLRGPKKWSYYYLYVILDVFSRYVVGWMVADRESSDLAKRLIEGSCKKESIQSGQLTLHADRGSSMKSKPVAFLLADLGVTKTHSRPYTSNDNPYSESHFKTLKYCPHFPGRFGCIEDARVFCRAFFQWYNHEHRHSGINRLTPYVLHHGLAPKVLEKRNQVLSEAFLRNPERFKNKVPHAGGLPSAAWINPPDITTPCIQEEKTL